MGESGEDSGLDLHCTDYRDPVRLSTLFGDQVPPQVPLRLSTIPPKSCSPCGTLWFTVSAVSAVGQSRLPMTGNLYCIYQRISIAFYVGTTG